LQQTLSVNDIYPQYTKLLFTQPNTLCRDYCRCREGLSGLDFDFVIRISLFIIFITFWFNLVNLFFFMSGLL